MTAPSIPKGPLRSSKETPKTERGMPPHPSPGSPTEGRSAVQRPHVLVIDDEPQIVRALRTILSQNGYQVASAGRGEEGLALAAAAPPDVIILDLGLPDMDGITVCERLREWTRTPIIVLSVRDADADKVAALDRGADDYLTKPFSADELLARFGLPKNKKIRELSRGNRARVCLVTALAFNPELIILDEPTSGLDPIVRRDFLENIIWEIGQEGRTVLFSSHIVEEVERIADYVAIIDNGQILSVSTVEKIKGAFRRIRFSTNGNTPDLKGLPGLLAVIRGRHEQILTIQNFSEDSLRLLAERGVQNPESIPMSLEEIFVDSVRARRRVNGTEDAWEVRYESKHR